MDIFIVTLFSYLSGSIPFGIIFTKTFGKIDLRKIGSGNIGATNVLRTGNKYLAASTLLFDVLKGYFPVMITSQHYPELIQLSCMLAFLGHLFPIWLKFNGGKGVATYLGVLFALSLQFALLFIFTWIAVTLIFRYSSVSSMFSSLTVFVISLIKETALPLLKSLNPNRQEYGVISSEFTFLLFIFFILLLFTHRKNISNLKNKSEQKIKI